MPCGSTCCDDVMVRVCGIIYREKQKMDIIKQKGGVYLRVEMRFGSHSRLADVTRIVSPCACHPSSASVRFISSPPHLEKMLINQLAKRFDDCGHVILQVMTLAYEVDNIRSRTAAPQAACGGRREGPIQGAGSADARSPLPKKRTRALTTMRYSCLPIYASRSP